MPVIIPILLANFILINAGIRTLAIAMPAPINSVPMYSIEIPPVGLKTSPIDRTIKTTNKTTSIPNLLARRGANGDKIANASKGIVVNAPTMMI